MINSSDITIILPIFNLKDNRLKSFYCVLDSISKTDLRVLVCEQVKEEDKKIDLSNYGSNISYINTIIDSNLIHKSKLINLAVSACNTTYIWQLDSDVIMKWEQILENINDEEVIRPFESIIRLTEEETEKYYLDKTVTVKKDDTRVAITSFGPISFIIKKDIFLAEGGMCERYEGWGFEDLDFARKIKSKYKVYIIKKAYGVHLWHPHTETKKEESEKNRKIFLENGKDITPTQYIPFFSKINDTAFKFVHIISYFSKDENSNKRQLLANSSIERNLPKNSIQINLPYEKKSFLNNTINVSIKEDKPFIDEILNVAFSYCDNDDDIIVFTNSDCIVDSQFYDNIKNNISSICFFYRRDIFTNCDIELNKIYSMNHEINTYGIDGIAMTKLQYQEIRNYLPHMKIAEPYWDSAINQSFIKNDIFVNNLFGILYHIEHDRFWSLKDRTHNYEYMSKNFVIGHQINKDLPLSDNPLISVVCCSYMSTYNQDVINAQKIFLKNIRYQNIPHEVIFVEMGFDKKYYFEDVVDIGAEVGLTYKHIKIEGSEYHKHIFHKESLWNIGKKHTSTNILLFCDSDIISQRTDWLKLIYSNLINSINTVMQPFAIVEDTVDEEIKYVSRVSRIVDKNYYYNKSNPGICWAMTTKMFEEIGGFNNLCILGDGDTCFLEENIDHKVLPPEKMASTWKCFVSLKNKRKIENKKQMICLSKVNLLHINHGTYKNRKYMERNFILYYVQERLKKNYTEYLELGDVNKWKKLDNELILMIKEKLNIPEDEEKAFRYFDKIICDSMTKKCEGGFKIFDLPVDSSLKYFSKYYGNNLLQKVKNQSSIVNLNNSNFILFEGENKSEYSEVNIFINNWIEKDLINFKYLFINYIGNEKNRVFFKFINEENETIEKILFNGLNDISDICEKSTCLRIRFKDKISINKLYLLRGVCV